MAARASELERTSQSRNRSVGRIAEQFTIEAPRGSTHIWNARLSGAGKTKKMRERRWNRALYGNVTTSAPNSPGRATAPRDCRSERDRRELALRRRLVCPGFQRPGRNRARRLAELLSHSVSRWHSRRVVLAATEPHSRLEFSRRALGYAGRTGRGRDRFARRR